MKKLAAVCFLAALFVTNSFAGEGAVPKGIGPLDHVWVIVMENHSYAQIINNSQAPFANWYAKNANAATNYFAVGHPSLTNYLEIVGGSNFGVRSDNQPDWHNMSCIPNIVAHTVVMDVPSSSNVCPIAGVGRDAETPAIDLTNECPSSSPCPPGLIDIDGVKHLPPAFNTVGKTIGDQLAEVGQSWKSYQESLPPQGADNVTYSDGYFTDLSNIPSLIPGETQSLVKLYAAKHNPFVYFQSVQEGTGNNSLANVVGFEGANGLFEDLENGYAPAFSLIAPNQCTDQHGRGNAGPQCDFDPNDNGAQQGLNPALIYIGDLTLRNIVMAIHHSPVWASGRNAIVTVWDENDYSMVPNVNQVLTIVDTNYGTHGVQSSNFYSHFSLLKSIEGGLGLPCLNHACDGDTKVMWDLF